MKTSSKGCCGPQLSCCSPNNEFSLMQNEYYKIDGYIPEADYGLGCGFPTEFANIKKGYVVLDLGCGAGNDAFIARNLVGETGKVIGIDITEEMIRKANENKKKLKYDNVEFRVGDIENLSIEDKTIDVVISNCVLNLVPNKKRVFSEIYRVLKDGGHFAISDIVIDGELPEKLRKPAELYVGCIAGALSLKEYLDIIYELNFRNVVIKKSNEISLPQELLKKYLTMNEIEKFINSKNRILSITVYGEK
ncbi:MAG: arsenite methyltransferase [Melioribacter sp.]|nr:arsenite methyltransferase [Melioribacter sp.]